MTTDVEVTHGSNEKPNELTVAQHELLMMIDSLEGSGPFRASRQDAISLATILVEIDDKLGRLLDR